MKTREAVQQLHDLNLGSSEIAERLGITRATVAYHKSVLGVSDFKKPSREDWEQIQTLLERRISYKEIAQLTGVSQSAISRAVTSGRVSRHNILPHELTIEEYCKTWVNKKARSGFRGVVKARMIEEGRWTRCCQKCKREEWEGLPIPLELDHVDGNPKNNDLNNLRLLCCNCHYQTETWGNKKR